MNIISLYVIGLLLLTWIIIILFVDDAQKAKTAKKNKIFSSWLTGVK